MIVKVSKYQFWWNKPFAKTYVLSSMIIQFRIIKFKFKLN